MLTEFGANITQNGGVQMAKMIFQTRSNTTLKRTAAAVLFIYCARCSSSCALSASYTCCPPFAIASSTLALIISVIVL